MSIPLPFTAPVRGVSQYPAAVAQARRLDQAIVRHDPDNPYDPNACAIIVRGELVGYLPAALAARLVRTGSSWTGIVAEKLDGEHPGLRVTVTGAGATAPVGVPSGTVNQNSVQSPLPMMVPSGDTLPEPRAARALVRARSGRVLGTMVDRRGDRVVVATDRGEVPYPADLVVIED